MPRTPRCPRCAGLLVIEICWRAFVWARCWNCGARLDGVILAHQADPPNYRLGTHERWGRVTSDCLAVE